VLGEPRYYERFGFVADPALTYPGPPGGYFQRLVLRGDSPRGEVSYSAAFG
jgi:putative acetyltransferase